MSDFSGHWVALWPTAASTYAGRVDMLFWALVAVSASIALPAFFLMTVFVIRYHESRDVDRSHPPERRIWLEVGWTAIPFALTLVIFVLASVLYYDEEAAPANAMEIEVVAKQWMFTFRHPGGQRELDVLHACARRPAREAGDEFPRRHS